MRVRHTVQVEIARDTDMKRKLFSDDAQLSQVVIDTFQRQCNSHLSINPASIETLSFGDVTLVKGMYLETDADCLVRLNGSSDAIPIKKSNGAAKLFLEADISEVTVENQDTENILTGIYCVWGDPE